MLTKSSTQLLQAALRPVSSFQPYGERTTRQRALFRRTTRRPTRDQIAELEDRRSPEKRRISKTTETAITSGLERWCRRLWPRLQPPVFWVNAGPLAVDMSVAMVALASGIHTPHSFEFSEADAKVVPSLNVVKAAA